LGALMAFVLCSFVAWLEFWVKYVDAAAAAATRNSPGSAHHTRARPPRLAQPGFLKNERRRKILQLLAHS
jgi:hypothetical protein